MSRIEDMPAFAQRPAEIPAALYNLWRRAKLHHLLPLRLPMEGIPHVAMLVEEEAWICVNELQSDLPILAWIDFQDQNRDTLHLPVKCTLNYYHYAASKVRGPSLQQMAVELEQQLTDDNRFIT